MLLTQEILSSRKSHSVAYRLSLITVGEVVDGIKLASQRALKGG